MRNTRVISVQRDGASLVVTLIGIWCVPPRNGKDDSGIDELPDSGVRVHSDVGPLIFLGNSSALFASRKFCSRFMSNHWLGSRVRPCCVFQEGGVSVQSLCSFSRSRSDVSLGFPRVCSISKCAAIGQHPQLGSWA